MFLTHNFRRKGPGGRGQRIHRWIDAQFGDRALQNYGRIQVGERRGRCRISQVVRRHVHGLERSDGAFLGGGNAFLEGAHLAGQGRLVAHGAGRAAKQSRNFRASLREPENVVDEEQHVLILFVAEIFGNGEPGKRDAQAGSGWFVHLAVHQRNFRSSEIVLLDDAGFGHLVVEIVAFAGALTDPSEHRHTAMQLGDVIDQLHNDNGLAYAGTAERADFAALQEGADQINHFDAGGKNLRGRGLVLQRWRRAVDWVKPLRFNRPALVDGVAGDVEHTAHDSFTDRHRYGFAG